MMNQCSARLNWELGFQDTANRNDQVYKNSLMKGRYIAHCDYATYKYMRANFESETEINTVQWSSL